MKNARKPPADQTGKVRNSSQRGKLRAEPLGDKLAISSDNQHPPDGQRHDTVVMGPSGIRKIYQTDELTEQNGLPQPLEKSPSDWYEFMGIIGSGGMGAVFEAKHIVTQADGGIAMEQEVAVKRVSTDLAYSDEDEWTRRKRQFLSEVRILAELDHPNIVAVRDFVDRPDGLFCIMQRLKGMDAGDLLFKRGRLSWTDAKDIIMQTCSGLIAAHERGIIHLDIKPENIFVSIDIEDEKTTRILDFGISRAVRSDEQDSDGKVSGTPPYMAPEQLSGEPTDERTDIYALGVVMYEFLTGRVPFNPESDEFIRFALKVKHEDPPAINVPGVPEELKSIIMKCLAKDPDDRYSSVRDLKMDLKMVNGFENGSDGSWSPPPMPVKKSPSLKKILAIGSVVLGVLGAGVSTGLYYVISQQANGSPEGVGSRADSSSKTTSPDETRNPPDETGSVLQDAGSPDVAISNPGIKQRAERKVLIQTGIPDVSVYLGDEFLGKTSKQGRLLANLSGNKGSVKLRLARAGYKTLRVDIGSEQESAEVGMEPVEKARPRNGRIRTFKRGDSKNMPSGQKSGRHPGNDAPLKRNPLVITDEADDVDEAGAPQKSRSSLRITDE